MMYVGMIETRSLKILLKSFHENYSDLFIKTTRYNYLIMRLSLSLTSKMEYMMVKGGLLV